MKASTDSQDQSKAKAKSHNETKSFPIGGEERGVGEGSWCYFQKNAPLDNVVLNRMYSDLVFNGISEGEKWYTIRLQKIEKKTAVPSLFKWTKVRNGSDERRKRIERRSNTISSSNVVGDIGEDIFYDCMDNICLQDDNFLFQIFFITWVCFMFKQWSELNIWPPREVVYYYSPKDFKSKFPATRCIIDGTEIPIKKPKPLLTQQATFSTYKNQNTVKTLVSATPAGLIVDITKAYGGSTSDRQIIERGGLVSMCNPGDSIMADKGFNVQDIFAPKNVTVNIPSFFRKKTDFQVILF
ncbi:hypothetical protein LOTGIDRAFT_163243 [Lottia gigantea]|uniref:DDE Tnp4 domain-containing protein n=1 Tax=Lottia gigantea TaxID=225164 RepID=V4AEY4_LOTGI|nr:hypothetical protein LOTGIDRAFT_163243 [Lottia gigantea]ESO91881.1 hypothetical protein LOTGIDRAFT_163243 [Lottia gigantea]